MNYIDKIKSMLDQEMSMGDSYKSLLDHYALLVLTVGMAARRSTSMTLGRSGRPEYQLSI